MTPKSKERTMKEPKPPTPEQEAEWKARKEKYDKWRRVSAAQGKMYAALDDCDTAFAVINIGRDHGITPRAAKAMLEAWISVQSVMAEIHGPESSWAEAEKNNRATFTKLYPLSAKAEGQS